MSLNRAGKESWFPAAIEIFALTNLAIAQPLFNVLSKGPEFFLVRRNSSLEVFVFVAAVAIVIPLCLWFIELIIGVFSAKTRKYFHEFLIATLIALFFLAFTRNMRMMPDSIKVILSIIFGGLIVIARNRIPAIKSFFVFLFPAIVAVPAMFLLAPAISKVVSAKSPAIPVYQIDATAPVVILICDEFPLSILLNKEGNIDCERYPNFCKLAETSTWFRRASSVSDRTQEAVTALLTGRYPNRESLPTIFDHPENLFTLLNKTYEMNIQEVVSSLNPIKAGAGVEHSSLVDNQAGMLSDAAAVLLQTVLPPSYAQHFPSIQQTWSNFWESGSSTKSKRDKVLGRDENLQLFISQIKKSKRPGLFFKHTILPHGPWQYFPSGVDYNFARYAQPTMEDRGENWGDEVTAQRALQRHMLQTGLVDHEIGRLMRRLQEVDLFDSAVIVITGDHGISFKFGDQRRTLTDTNRADILSIPLFIKQPNQNSGRISDLPVETIDILPSIAASLKISVPWKVDGQSAIDENYRVRAERHAYQWMDKKGMVKSFRDFGISGNALTIQSHFGTDRPFNGLFFCRQFPDLYGRSVKGLQPASYSLASPQLFEDVNPDSGYVPALISGKDSIWQFESR